MPPLPALDPAPSDGAVALRRWRAADAPAMAAACADPEIAYWTLVPSPYGESHAREFVAGSAARWEAGATAELAVVDARDRERLLGSVGLVRIEWERGCAEIGYWVAPDARRRGVATAAVRLLSAWTFERLGLERIELMPYVGNEASARVAERAGYAREGTQPARLPHPAREVVLFSLAPA